METQKIVNLLNDSNNENSKFATTKKWYIIDSETKGNYLPNNEIKFLTSSLESNLCDYSDAYILVKEILMLQMVIIIQKLHLKIVHHLKNAQQK